MGFHPHLLQAATAEPAAAPAPAGTSAGGGAGDEGSPTKARTSGIADAKEEEEAAKGGKEPPKKKPKAEPIPGVCY